MHRQITIRVVYLVAVLGITCGWQGRTTGAPANEAEFTSRQVSLTVNVTSNVYTYELSNSGLVPIVGFELPHHAAYNFQAPQGWKIEADQTVFRTWCTRAEDAIAPGEKKKFSMRVSSKGAVLGRAPARLSLQGGQTTVIPRVWVPVHERRSYIWLIPAIICLLAVTHAILIGIRQRQKAKSRLSA